MSIEFDVDLSRLQREVRDWADVHFQDRTLASVLAHIREEVDELAAATLLEEDNGEVAEECADVGLLLLSIASLVDTDLASAMRIKHALNKGRRWTRDMGTHVKHAEVGGDNPTPDPPARDLAAEGAWSIPKGTDEWANGNTFDDMRRACPDPALTAHERNDPVELAAIAAGLRGWDAWEVYDGRYYEEDTYLTVTPGPDRFDISWDGLPEDRGAAVEVLRRFASALLAAVAATGEGGG